MTNSELLLSISRMMDTKLKAELQPLKEELQSVKAGVKEVKARLQNVETEVKEIKVRLQNVEKEVKEVKVGLQKVETEVHQVKGEVRQMNSEVQQIKSEVNQLRVSQENVIMPRLNTIESCYTSTYNRYRSYVEKMEEAFIDIDVLKMVVAEHSEKLLKLA